MKKTELQELAKMIAEELKMQQKKVLTLEETAIFLGVSTSTLYKWTMKKVIPHYKPNGGMCYFDRREVENWAMRYRIDTQEELDKQAEEYCRINAKIRERKQK